MITTSTFMSVTDNTAVVGGLLVPVALGILIKSREHDGQDLGSIVTD